LADIIQNTATRSARVVCGNSLRELRHSVPQGQFSDEELTGDEAASTAELDKVGDEDGPDDFNAHSHASVSIRYSPWKKALLIAGKVA
jgi:hypothetical protein